MSLIAEVAAGFAHGVATTDTPEGLSAIHRPGCAAVLWRRRPLPGFQAWIDALDPTLLSRARIILRPQAVRDAVAGNCEAAGMPATPYQGRFVDDVAALADIFSGTMRAKWLRLRLDVVTTNACRKFHVDAVTARLVCTYRGTGTQYGNTGGGDDPAHFETVPTGAPIVLRGTLWSEQPSAGLRHRSPPIEGTGETRLVLVLDPIDDPAEEV